MKFILEVKGSAREGVTEAFLYYEDKQEGLGERFLRSWEKHLESLQSDPARYQKRYKEFRQLLIKPYPYLIIYEIEQTTIVIYKVIYAGKHPRKLYSRKDR